jgi:magnesium-transporting ATPase (P-type)
VKYLAESVGITEVYAGRSPEEKVAIVKLETSKANALFVGDGINDAPALMAATVGVAFGTQNDITTEAADAVVLEPALGKIDELMHIGQRMRRITLQSALGGMAANVIGMVAASFGFLPPIWGAVGQGVSDLIAALNAVRVALPAEDLQDFLFSIASAADVFPQKKAGPIRPFLVELIMVPLQTPIGLAALVTLVAAALASRHTSGSRENRQASGKSTASRFVQNSY